jgi:hypothetical protein
MLLLEHKTEKDVLLEEFNSLGVKPVVFTGSREGLSEEFDRLFEREEFLRVMEIRPFNNRKILWMSMNCKYYMKNNKDQGYSHIDWSGLALAKHRR